MSTTVSVQMELSPLHQAFVAALCRNLNPSRAAVDVGLTRAAAPKLLRNPIVHAAIQQCHANLGRALAAGKKTADAEKARISANAQ